MLGNELLVRTARYDLGLSCPAHADRFPNRAVSPTILDRHFLVPFDDVMPHRQRRIRLAVEDSRHYRNRSSRHQLAHECYSASPAIACLAPDIKAEIYLLEIPMQRNRQTKETGLEKQETDNADECAAFVEIEFSPARNAAREERRIDRE